ncbi:MAG TPA: hypothetical protein VK775_01420, partial [Chthoniobacterales bacterium]|nr:hypothetical protein [Chthoniobacterales bacterium]
TEVTEVTEGGLRFSCGRLFGGQLGFWAGDVHQVAANSLAFKLCNPKGANAISCVLYWIR